MKRLILIPAFNEQEALPLTLKELLPTLDADTHVLVINDGSSDRTAEVGRLSGALVLSLPFNLGIGGALRAGFKYAQQHSYEQAVQFDADGQHRPEAVPALWAALDGGADLVIGNRFAGQGEYEVSWARGMAMGGLRKIFRLYTKREFSDTSSGFRGFGARTISLFADRYPVEYMESTESLMYACISGLNVVEVPCVMHHRVAGMASNRRGRLAFHYVRLFLVLVTNRRNVVRVDEVAP